MTTRIVGGNAPDLVRIFESTAPDFVSSGTLLTGLPVLILFVIAQRQFIEGLAHTGLKG